ncbi:hypothetical protein D1B31_04635 [Neobacillus notoginsengisoli]|uniref:Uncharacterized protein n=1 Tax=Neobacillus notoginsengisoli TaxID=1578198 RepID=A0A417YWJ2_9BACI|nr:hypothetical protein [Neobacillus notoginsengisoli]RHW41941.1 hypothetical protein D1B31_04635 [Neobacillus notoginsengisoli]
MQKNEYDFHTDIPNSILEGMNLETILISPVEEDLFIGVLSKEVSETNNVLLYLYLLEYSGEGSSFSILKILQSLSFSDISSARLFIQSLSEMSAMDFILSIDPNDVMVIN